MIKYANNNEEEIVNGKIRIHEKEFVKLADLKKVKKYTDFDVLDRISNDDE